MSTLIRPIEFDARTGLDRRAAVATAPAHLSRRLRVAVAGTAAIDLVIGLAFLFGPELGLTLWPSAIAPVLMRFIGAIVLANGVGAAQIARRGSWESARTLFTVALVYGVTVLAALLYHLLVRGGAAPVFWLYVALDALFLVPIAAIYWRYERAAVRARSPQAYCNE